MQSDTFWDIWEGQMFTLTFLLSKLSLTWMCYINTINTECSRYAFQCLLFSLLSYLFLCPWSLHTSPTSIFSEEYCHTLDCSWPHPLGKLLKQSYITSLGILKPQTHFPATNPHWHPTKRSGWEIKVKSKQRILYFSCLVFPPSIYLPISPPLLAIS